MPTKTTSNPNGASGPLVDAAATLATSWLADVARARYGWRLEPGEILVARRAIRSVLDRIVGTLSPSQRPRGPQNATRRATDRPNQRHGRPGGRRGR